MPSTRHQKYQEGSIDRVSRAKGPDVWVYRWSEKSLGGQRLQRKRVIGTVQQFASHSAAKRAVENLRAEINADRDHLGDLTVCELWGHFQANELHNPNVDRSFSTIALYLDDFKRYILPFYRADEDWVFASEVRNGAEPVWLDIVLQNYVQPAAVAAKITKKVGWHTFRRSLATLLAAKGENVKVVQELLRHSNPSVTLHLYQQGDEDQKRAAQGHTSDLFLVRRAS